jgi:hypothetical protein
VVRPFRGHRAGFDNTCGRGHDRRGATEEQSTLPPGESVSRGSLQNLNLPLSGGVLRETGVLSRGSLPLSGRLAAGCPALRGEGGRKTGTSQVVKLRTDREKFRQYQTTPSSCFAPLNQGRCRGVEHGSMAVAAAHAGKILRLLEEQGDKSQPLENLFSATSRDFRRPKPITCSRGANAEGRTAMIDRDSYQFRLGVTLLVY